MPSALHIFGVVSAIPVLLLLRWMLFSLLKGIYAELFTSFNSLPEAPGSLLSRWTVGTMLQSFSPMSSDTLSGAQEILRLSKSLGRTFKSRMFFGTPLIMTTDPVLIKYILLQRPDRFVKAETVKKLLGPILGPKGIFVSDGKDHRRMRRAIMPSFHSNNLLKFSEWFLARAESVADGWLEMSEGKTNPILVDVFSDVTRMTFDIIVWTVFGSTGTTDQERQHMYDLYKRSMATQFVDFRGFVLMRLFPFIPSSTFGSISQEMQEIRQMVRLLVVRARDSPQNKEASESNGSMTPLIQTLLGDSFNLEESCDNVLTFLGAGQATSAVTLCWLFYNLAKKPRYQDMIRKELAEIDFDPKSAESLANVSGCRILDDAVKETLRLNPPVAYFVRTILVDDVVNGVSLPRGYNVRVAVKAMQIDPEFWGSDVLEFVPERWDRPGEKLRERMSWLPFLYGERSCIGNRFAMLEIKACAACVLSKMELSIDERDPPARANTSLGTPIGMKIYARPRSSNNSR